MTTNTVRTAVGRNGSALSRQERARRLATVVLAGSFLFVSACAGNHRDQPYYEAQEPSTFFEDDKAMRQLVPNTVAQGQERADEHLYTGEVAGTQVATFPFPVTDQVLRRGQQQYNAHCVPCHGYAGNGDGMIVRRGYSRPQPYHTERLREVPEGYIFDVITNGYGAMPAYAEQVYPRDRWAIIAYIRALQLSQNAPVDQLPAEDREALENPPTPVAEEAENEEGEGE